LTRARARSHALLLAAREFAGAMAAAISEVNFMEPDGGGVQRFPLADAAGKQRHGHVFQSGDSGRR